MTMHLRIYPSEQDARDVGAKLATARFENHSVFLASEHQGRAAASVEEATQAGKLPERKIQICTRSLEQGRSLVAVEVPFGLGQPALDILDSAATVDTDVLNRYYRDDAAPLSELMCIPVLSDYSPSTGLKSSNWSLSSLFGFGLLSRNPAPLSSMTGMKPLSAPKKKTSSFGMALLSNNATPLSSLLGMKAISAEKKSEHSNFGLPYLSENPAPLSSLLGMKTLTDSRSSLD